MSSMPTAARGPERTITRALVRRMPLRGRQGMKAMLRYSSAWQDVAEGVKAITKLHLDPRHFILCSDDCHAGTLVDEGHMDRILRHAIQQGLAPMTALQMASINTAEHFGVSREVGMIAPGRWADILLVEDLKDFHAGVVILRGRLRLKTVHCWLNCPKWNTRIGSRIRSIYNAGWRRKISAS